MAASHNKHAPSIFPIDGASPEPRDAAIALSALVTLQTSSTRYLRSMHALESLCGWTKGPPMSAMMVPIPVGAFIAATAAVSRALRQIGGASERLKVQVIPFDRMLFGETVESVEELVVRGQVFVVATCLRHLRDRLPSASIDLHCVDPIRDVFQEFPGGIQQVIRYAEQKLHRIISRWKHLRRGDDHIPGRLATSIFARYEWLHRAAVLAAQREMHGLMDDELLAAFLRAGVEHREDPEVQTACARITIALQIRLSAELTLPLPRAGAAGSVTGTWPRTTHLPVSA